LISINFHGVAREGEDDKEEKERIDFLDL